MINEKIYYSHFDLIKDLIETSNNEAVFYCDFKIYTLSTYSYGNDDRGFNWFKQRIRQVIKQGSEFKIILGDRLLSEHNVLLTSYGFSNKEFVEIYYCFDVNSLISILLNFQKQDINRQIMKINKKYNTELNSIIKYERNTITEK